MILAYLTNQYGRASDTFIRQEVMQLRGLGHTVHTFSTRRPEADHQASAEAREAQATTDYILDHGALRLLGSLAACAFTQPGRMVRALGLAWRTRGPGLKPLVMQGVYLVEAAYLARRLDALMVEHLHNHIGMNSATVAMLAATLAGIGWSQTVHGPHDFFDATRWALPQKMGHAALTVFIADYGRSQGMMMTPPSVWPRLHVVRCGVDGTFLGQPVTPILDGAPLLFVGRLSPEKGVLVLIEALGRLRREGLTVPLRVIGDGPSRGEMVRAAAAAGLGEAVTFLGWQGSGRVRDELLGCRALVLPSFAEGLPVVLMEAMALHRPVVSTYVAGIPELVVSGENGLLTAAGSVDELVEAVRTIMALPPDKLAAMGRHGAQRVAARHDAAVNARRLAELLAEAARSGTARTTERG